MNLVGGQTFWDWIFQQLFDEGKETVRRGLLSICIVIAIWGRVYAQEGELPPPTPTIDYDLGLYHFPISLYCQEIDTSSNAGPRWGQVQIGQSSLSDLEAFVTGLSDAYETDGVRGSWIVFALRGAPQADTDRLPSGIRACILDNVVWFIGIGVGRSGFNLFIEDIVAAHGRPDAVTWSEFLDARLAFWFEDGIAVEFVTVDYPIGSPLGEVSSVMYFPYQAVDGFENRWPYNRTRTTPPSAGDEVHIPPWPTEQNPVDFDMMMATLTAEPSRTPTPSFSPLATDVPTR